MILTFEQMKCTHTDAHTHIDSNLCGPPPGLILPLLYHQNSSQGWKVTLQYLLFVVGTDLTVSTGGAKGLFPYLKIDKLIQFLVV